MTSVCELIPQDNFVRCSALEGLHGLFKELRNTNTSVCV